MRRQLRGPVPITVTWYGSGTSRAGGLVVPTVPLTPPVAWVQHPTDRTRWLTMVRKPEKAAPSGSVVTLWRKRV